MERPAHLVVGLVKKPHGVKGEVLVHPVTDEPDAVFRERRVLAVVDRDGRPTGQELVVARARQFHRAWLLHFEGAEDRFGVEPLRDQYVALRAEDVRDLEPGEFYYHELVGMQVVTGEQAAVGAVAEVLEAPQGPMLVVRSEAKEHLVPFAPWLVRKVDRAARTIEIAPPPGLLEV